MNLQKIVENTEYIHDEHLEQTKISDSVLAVCAVNATLKIKGVAGLTGSLTDSITKNILGKESLTKGIKVNQTEHGVVLDIYLIVKYGVKIPAVAWDVQKAVKQEIESMTARPVAKVNIHVEGVLAQEKERNE